MKILFITSNRLGDAVLSTGLLKAYMDHFPTSEVTVVCGPVASSLFEACPQIVRVIAMPKRKYGRHWMLLWRQMIGQKWDYIIDLRRSIVSPFLRSKRKVIVSKAPDHLHRVSHLARFAPISAQQAQPHIWLSPEDHQWAAKVLNTQEGGERFIAIGPAANWRGKQWRARRFAELAEKLVHKSGRYAGYKVVILVAPSERAQSQEMISHLQDAPFIDLTGVGTPRQIAACLACCEAYIGNDSGLMHISAALGRMTFGLFGPSRPKHYSPWGAQNCVIQTPETYEQLVDKPGYNPVTTDSLMDGLTVDAVHAQIMTHLTHKEKS